MNTQSLTAGSPFWQTLFVSFGAVFILWEILRGWQLGLLRQLVRVAAVIAAYASAFFGGRAAVPLLRNSVKAPDLILASLAGAVLALVVYFVLSGAGALLFKRTAEHQSRIVRLIYGSSGALLGIFFGVFFIWLLLLGIRSVGAIADAQVRATTSRFATRAEGAPGGSWGEASAQHLRAAGERESVSALLARLKNSIELGAIGHVVRETDVIPTGAYQIIGQVGEVFARPESAERFFSYPGARALSEHPKIVALQSDPEIARLLAEGRLVELLQNDRLIDALNDPTLLERVKHFDLQRALDYALKK